MSRQGREVIKYLKENGWTFERMAKGSHEIWRKGEVTYMVSISASSNIDLKRARRKIQQLEQQPFIRRQT
jgi:predicted RNA binding protein YcfA (HicA-like mRNA interferase family)